METAPRRLKRLEIRMMQHLVQLSRNEMIKLSYTCVDHQSCITADRDRAVEHLIDELADQVAASLARSGIRPHAAVHNYLIQHTVFGSWFICGAAHKAATVHPSSRGLRLAHRSNHTN